MSEMSNLASFHMRVERIKKKRKCIGQNLRPLPFVIKETINENKVAY